MRMARGSKLGVLLLALTLLHAEPLEAKGDAWSTAFEALDPSAVYTRIEEAKPADAEALFNGALHARLPTTAVAAGDALRTRGVAWLGTASCARARKKAQRLRRPDQLANLARVLGAWGKPAFDGELAVLGRSRKEAVQIEALFMIGALPGKTKPLFPESRAAALKALESRRAAVIGAACAAVGRLQIAEAQPTLEKLVVRAKEPWVGIYAVRALERLDVTIDLAPILLGLRRKPKPPQRAAGLKALATLARPSQAGVLLAMLRATDPDLRRAALAGLRSCASPQAYGASSVDAPTLASIDGPLRRELAEALVERSLGDEDPSVQAAATELLGRLGPGVLPRDVSAWLTHDRPEVRAHGAALGARLGLASAYDGVLDLALHDDDEVVRRGAARALEKLDPGRAAIDLRVRALRGEGAEAGRAVSALGFVRQESALDALLALLGAAQDEDRRRGIEHALERLTGHRCGADPAAWAAWRKAEKVHFLAAPAWGDRRARAAAVRKDGSYGHRVASTLAMERGLAWLESKQHAGGWWAGAEDGLSMKHAQQGVLTALSVMAFVGAGYVPAEGRHRETLWRACEFLAATQGHDGRPRGRAEDRVGMARIRGLGTFVVPMGTWALIEAFEVDRSGARRGPAQRAIDAVVQARRHAGGWGRDENEGRGWSTPTAFFGMALCIARALDLQVPEQALDHADAWLSEVSTDMSGTAEIAADRTRPQDQSVGTAESRPSVTQWQRAGPKPRKRRGKTEPPGLNELALLYWSLRGRQRSHPAMIGAATYLQGWYPTWDAGDSGQPCNWTHARLWFGGWSLVHIGGAPWRRWSDRMQRTLQAHELLAPPGSWGSTGPDKRNTERGALFATAAAVLALQSWHRFPIKTATK